MLFRSVYRKRIWKMIRRIPDMFRHPLKNEFLLLIVATIPAVIAALVIDFDDAFAGEYLGFSFLLTTLILWLSDLVSGLAPQIKKVGLPQAIVMGIMQAVAILPGVSRSGSTIAGGVSAGLSRKRAADFAFLMAIPAILGSAVLEGVKLIRNPEVVTGSWMPIIVGVLVSAAAGYLAIRLMLKIIRRVRLTWFGVYTGVLGILVLLDQYMFHYFF